MHRLQREPLLDPDEAPRVREALDTIATALSTPPDDVTLQRHRLAIARARASQPLVLARRVITSGAVAAALVGVLAFGGALPGPAQQVAADLASKVGIILPRPPAHMVPSIDLGADDPTSDVASDDRAAEPAARATGPRSAATAPAAETPGSVDLETPADDPLTPPLDPEPEPSPTPVAAPTPAPTSSKPATEAPSTVPQPDDPAGLDPSEQEPEAEPEPLPDGGEDGADSPPETRPRDQFADRKGDTGGVEPASERRRDDHGKPEDPRTRP